jgi:sec-independent protein translocase protein TatA
LAIDEPTAFAQGGIKNPMNVSTGEIVFIVVVLVIVFSASRMGSLGNALGKFVYSFKKATKGEGFVDVKPGKTFSSKGAEDAHIVEDPKKKP